MSKRENAFVRFNELLDDSGDYTKQLPVGNGHKYAVCSDLHLADGGLPDRFRRNKDVAVKALRYYKKNGYSIILSGDIEDFHRRDSNAIEKKYGRSVYKALKEFSPEKIHRIFGNHDIEWSLRDPIGSGTPFAAEAVKLGKHILVVHGHQAEEFYEKDIHIVRAGATLARLKESILGPHNSYSVTQLPGDKDKIYADWAKEKKKIIICGHTHKPVFASRSIFDWVDIKIQLLDREIEKEKSSGNKDKVKYLRKRRRWFNYRSRFVKRKLEAGMTYAKLDPDSPYYFNAGGGIYLDGITNIEIDGNIIRLIYWRNTDEQREQIWGDEDMNKILGRDVSG